MLRTLPLILACTLLLAACTDSKSTPDTTNAMDVATSEDTPEDEDVTTTEVSTAADAEEDATTVEDAAEDAPDDDVSTEGGLEALLTPELFASLFLHQSDPACNAAAFSYDALITAAADFPDFATVGDSTTRARELAAFLANISHETTGGWATAPDGPFAWGLCFREEVGCESGGCTGYCDSANTTWPCAANQTYHGRGPMQLSWNYNYGQAGDALGLDLLSNPALVAQDGVVAWKTALWFWMTPQTPKPSAHDVMTGLWTPSTEDTAAGRLPGFGMTVNIINGGLECGIPDDSRVADRVGFFLRYTDLLSTTPGDNLTCEAMQSY